jgi:glutathione S-transferase
MKLYNSNLAPNPRRVRIALAEKGVSIPRVEVDLGKLEHKTSEFSALNPFQTIPILELDDGTRIAESIAICRYIEALWPEPNLFGLNPLEQAVIEMWQRQLELRLLLPIAQVFASHPSAHGGNGDAPGPRLGGDQPAKGASCDGDRRRGAARPAVHRRRPLHRRGHHGTRGARFRQAGAHRDPVRARQPQPLARGAEGPAQRRGVRRRIAIGSGLKVSARPSTAGRAACGSAT